MTIFGGHPDLRDVVMIAYVLVSLLASSIGIPETIRLVRGWNTPDEKLPYRLFTVLVLGVLTLVKLWRAAIWFDWVYFGQELFGSIDHRVPYELGLLTVFIVAMMFATLLYWFPHAMTRFTFWMLGRKAPNRSVSQGGW